MNYYICLFMSGNSFGKIFKLTTFGESHGPAIGGVIEGMPAGFKIDFNHKCRRQIEVTSR